MRASLSAAELAVGYSLGRDPRRAALLAELQRSATRCTPVDALLDAVERCMPPKNSVPWFVQFSGGLDSSVVLAAAVEVSRRHGRTAPVPVTVLYSDVESDESAYQALMVRHLALTEWIRLRAPLSVDILSEDAQDDLLRHGLSASPRVPTWHWFYRAVGGPSVVLSGEGGDEIFQGGPLAPVFFALGAIKSRAGVAHATRILAERTRGRLSARLHPDTDLPDWLTPEGRRAVSDSYRATFAIRSMTVRGQHREVYSIRSNETLFDDVQRLAAEHGVRYLEPLMDPRFIAELTSSVPDRHFIDRNRLFRRYFPSLVPAPIANRTSKARFNAAVFGDKTRSFVQAFKDYDCLPLDFVDPVKVRSAWLDGSDARCGLLLQHAWLATQGGR